MCVICFNALQKHFPLLTGEQRVELAWSCTCYPAGEGNQVEEQLAELERKSNGSFEDAMEISYREFDEVWEATRPEREKRQREEEEAERFRQLQERKASGT